MRRNLAGQFLAHFDHSGLEFFTLSSLVRRHASNPPFSAYSQNACGVHKIGKLDRIRQRIGRIGKAPERCSPVRWDWEERNGNGAALLKGGWALAVQESKTATSTWQKNELRRIAEADDLHIAPFREDGVTYGTPTWIWSVAVEDALYVRGYNGQNSRWYQAAVRQKAGRIIAAGMTKEVTFEAVDGPINDRIDDAYRAKYRGSPYLKPMIGVRARAATVRVMPGRTKAA
jgi:hypothetical protein